MLNFKKGLAVVMAAATALTFAPVANLGPAVTAKAAAADGGSSTLDADSSTSEQKATVVARNGYVVPKTGATYLVRANNADAWKALEVKFNADNELHQKTTDSKDSGNFEEPSVAEGAEARKLTPTFTDKLSGLNGTYTFTLIQVDVQERTIQHEEPVAFWTVELKNSKPSWLTAGKITNESGFVGVDSAEFETKTDAFGNNSYYSVDYGKSYTVTYTLPEINGKSVSKDNSDLTFTLDGSSVEVTPDKNEFNKATVKAVSEGKTVVTATWTSKNDVNGGPSKGQTIDSVSFTVVVDKVSNTKISYQGIGQDKETDNTTLLADNNDDNNPAIQLDTLIKKTAKINVTADVTPTFVSSAPSKVTVASDGTVTAVAYGQADITIYVGDKNYTVPVYVADQAEDQLNITVNGENFNPDKDTINLDLSSSTAATAKKSAKIAVTSAGSLATSFYLVGASKSDSAVAGNANEYVSVANDGTITAGNKVGTQYIIVKSTTSGKVSGASKYIAVKVNSKPEAAVSVDNVNLDLTNNKTADINVVTDVTNPTIDYYVEKKSDDEDTGIVTRLGKKLTAVRYGTATLRVKVAETATTRATEASAKIYVLQNAAKKASDLKVTNSAVEAKVGETAKIDVTATIDGVVASGSALTYKSDAEDVATVAADGTITAVKAGTAVITVTAPEGKSTNAGTAYVKVTVTAPVQKPAKVTGVKVTNVKGGKVKVTWTKDSNPNVKYYVKKTVNGKKAGKSVGSNSTTLSVKKGATVKVQVKAYVYDSANKLVGSYSKTVSKKTDKK